MVLVHSDDISYRWLRQYKSCRSCHCGLTLLVYSNVQSECVKISQSASVAVLSHINDLNEDWLCLVLGVEVNHFSATQIVGVGYASRMYRLKVDHSRGGEVPSSFILKLVTDNAAMLEIVEPSLYREVMFYQKLADKELSAFLPGIYFAKSDKEQQQLTLLMEDLGDIPPKPYAEKLENSISAMQALAKAHAHFWNAEVLQSDTLQAVDAGLDIDSILKAINDSLAIEQDAEYSFPYLRTSMLNLVKFIKWTQRDTDTFKGPITLVHGDFHSRNIHFSESGPMVYDWQMIQRGQPARDVIYWLITSVAAKDFAEHQPILIDAYLKALRENGVADYDLKAFRKDSPDTAMEVIARVYCYQGLITVSDEDQQEVVDWIANAEHLAKQVHMLAMTRIGRVIYPLVGRIKLWFVRFKKRSAA